MKRFFDLYQYLAPAVLFPLGYWLWYLRGDGDHRYVALGLGLPVLFAYVIPGLGTNWLKLWEFNTRLRLGRFRPHHGFVFGSATSLFALACIPVGGVGPGEMLRAGFVLGSVLAFWNWLYDDAAIRAGFLRVYNRPFQQEKGPEAIATDYAPVLFGTFGMCYGLLLGAADWLLLASGRWQWFWPLLLGGAAVLLVAPVAAFVGLSYLRHGTSGLKPLHPAELTNGVPDRPNVGSDHLHDPLPVRIP